MEFKSNFIHAIICKVVFLYFFFCCVQFDPREADKSVEGNALERTSALLLECPEARV